MIQVWVNGQPSGLLGYTGEDSWGVDCLFQYFEKMAPELGVSLGMPTSTLEWDYQGLHPIFQMNLPEGALRALLDRQFAKAVPGYGDLELLRIVGRSQIGRLRYSAKGEELHAVGEMPTQSVEDILRYDGTDDLFHDLLEKYAEWSGISGVQPKVLIRDFNEERLGGVQKKIAHRGATHIVKTWDEYSQLAANEYFCLQAAKTMGLEVPKFSLSDDAKFLVIDRFDILPDGSYLGFEDGCVLGGIGTEYKYDSDYETLADILYEYLSPDLREKGLKAFFESLALSIAVRNGDAHLKNYGILYEAPIKAKKRWIAPVYDIVTTTAYVGNDTLALSMNNSKAWPASKVLLEFAQRFCMLSKGQAKETLEKTADILSDIAQQMCAYAKDHPDFTRTSFAMLSAWAEGVKESLSSNHKSVQVLEDLKAELDEKLYGGPRF